MTHPWSGRRGSNSPPIAWKAIALPNELLPHILQRTNCGQGWIRTTELRRGQIYSLLPLATWLLARILKKQEKSFAFHCWLSHLSESNQRPTDYKSVALPAELKWRFLVIHFIQMIVKLLLEIAAIASGNET